MRGAPHAPAAPVRVLVRNFAWERPAIATMRHSSLPWLDHLALEIDLAAAPLVAALSTAGARDRLSLIGQFAAHRAFLQFAGIADGEFDSAEWVIVRKRGCDCRLVRISARATTADDDVPALVAIQQFAELVKAPSLDVLRRSWARPETAFAEVYRRVRADAAADLRWLQRSAFGEIVAPGPDTLRAVWHGPPRVVEISRAESFISLAAMDESVRCVVLGSEFAIQRYAALRPLDPSVAGSAESPASVAEALIERLAAQRHVLVVGSGIDDASRKAIDIVIGANVAIWITPPTGGEKLPDSVFMLVSTRVGGGAALAQRLSGEEDSRGWLGRFVATSAFDRYLETGDLPTAVTAFDRLEEPRRSYLAALALLGTRIPRALAAEYLHQFLFDASLEQLAVSGLTVLDDGEIRFVSEQVREHCSRYIPDASKAALCRAAASVADRTRAGALLIEAGETALGAELLEGAEWSCPEDAVGALRALPRSALSPRLATRFADALVSEGRYDDARDIAALLPESEREVVLARCDRRTGDYATALSRLRRLASTRFDAAILQAELLRLTGALAEARRLVDDLRPESQEQQTRAEYEKGIIALEAGVTPEASWAARAHYFASRFLTYDALTRGAFEEAEQHASQSMAQARCISERIDAALDRVFASFSAGRWEETRRIAVESLAIIDEAQGDRAAAGILFTLAYLAADDGQWAAAAQHIRRLRQYYTTAADEPRLAEIDLLSAQLEMSRGNFGEAKRLASMLEERALVMSQIREAAALIVDEIDWIEHRNMPLRSRGVAHNRELEDRHHMMLARRGKGHRQPRDPFFSALLAWESASQAPPPEARTRAAKLKLMRSAMACSRDDVAQLMAAETGANIAHAKPELQTADVDVLRAAAAAAFPFRSDTFGALRWCFASRNRLGQWAEEGTAEFESALFDRMLAEGEVDWMVCSEREVLFIEDSRRWPEASRQAIAALFRTRAENHRLRRLLEQEEAARPGADEAVEGIVGDSPAIRAVFAVIDRVARRDVPVCVLGESGTGKELIGRAIHRASPRKHKPFTAVNCAALPETLVESELFGHMRGAFTGADRDRAGLIETTDGGTLFLDEIGEMPLPAQAKLLRFLQDGEFRRVGDTVNRTADVRIVSATNRKLEQAVEEGRFREDLYYRIRGIDIALPRLRDRGRDVVLLAQHFLDRERARHRAGPQALSPEAEALLASYEWPGNVRELQNTIRAAHAIAGDAREIDIDHLPERVRSAVPVKVAAGSYQDAVARFRRELIEKSLAAAAGNQNRAAALLNISRQALAYQIRELGILVGKNPMRARL